jgi:hypothetical protein
MEPPQYVCRPNVRKSTYLMLIKMIPLCLVFYVGVLVNFYLLDFKAPFSVHVLVVAILIVIVAMYTTLSYVNTSKTEYLFFLNRIEKIDKRNKEIALAQIRTSRVVRGFLDKSFNTGSIVLSPGLVIKDIDNVDQIYQYLQNLIRYARGRYQ